LILTGNSKKSVTLLQNYLNTTDDLLVTLILSKFFTDPKDPFAIKCESELSDNLNRMKMFNERIHLTLKLSEIISHMEKGYKNMSNDKKMPNIGSLLVPTTELILNCFYCNAKLSSDKADQFKTFSSNNKEYKEFVSK
jgi:hypothetical protein